MNNVVEVAKKMMEAKASVEKFKFCNLLIARIVVAQKAYLSLAKDVSMILKVE